MADDGWLIDAHPPGSIDRKIPQHPRKAQITASRPQSCFPEPLDLLHRTGSIARNAERQTEIETAVSRDQDQDVSRNPGEGRNSPAVLAPMVDNDGLDNAVSGLFTEESKTRGLKVEALRTQSK